MEKSINDILNKNFLSINQNTHSTNNQNNNNIQISNNTKSNIKANEDLNSYTQELESKINILKKKIFISENNLKNASSENPDFFKANQDNQFSLYETILIYIKNINIQHLLEIYNLHLQKEDEIHKVLNSHKNPNENDLPLKIKNLSEKLFHLTKHCELAFNDYEIRSKSYISIEDFEKKLEEYKNFIEQNLNNLLSLLVANMMNNNEFVIFKLNNLEYNQALENISFNLEKYNKLNYDMIQNYKRNFYSLQSALEIIQRQARVEYENIKSIILDENYNN